ncbi:MAG: tetratricopeptide repeat protein, partial [Xanthomonadales bacterium]|nr:tetratricopeptide repeat protein [Xanthomonadales bacterium]
MAIIGMLLASVVAAAAPDDIARLNKEAKALLRSDPQRAQQIAQQALQLAQARTDPAGEAGARINLGSIERQRGRYDQAVVEFERAVALTDDAKAQLPYADALTQLGVTLDMSGLHAEALEAESKALAIYEGQQDAARISAALINLG